MLPDSRLRHSDMSEPPPAHHLVKLESLRLLETRGLAPHKRHYTLSNCRVSPGIDCELLGVFPRWMQSRPRLWKSHRARLRCVVWNITSPIWLVRSLRRLS